MIGTESKYDGTYFRHRTEVEEALAKLKGFGVTDYVLLSKDGMPIVNCVQNKGNIEAHMETIAIMAATIYGAANTTNSELRKTAPSYIRVDSKDAISIIANTGARHFLLAVGTPDLENKINSVLQIAKDVESILE